MLGVVGRSKHWHAKSAPGFARSLSIQQAHMRAHMSRHALTYMHETCAPGGARSRYSERDVEVCAEPNKTQSQ